MIGSHRAITRSSFEAADQLDYTAIKKMAIYLIRVGVIRALYQYQTAIDPYCLTTLQKTAFSFEKRAILKALYIKLLARART